MKRILICLPVIIGLCILFTGCNSLFLGDTTVDLPQQSGINVPSAQTGYRDTAGDGKFQGDGDEAFYFMPGHSKETNDIIQFICLDYIEETSSFVYAYQTMLNNGSGKMVTEMISYSPVSKEGTEFFSMTTDPNVEPTMFAQRVDMDNDKTNYFIYFGGYATFFLQDGTLYSQVEMKPMYMDVVEKLGNIKDLTILSASVSSGSGVEYMISMNFMAERTQVDENTEWTDDMKESDTLPETDGKEGSVSFRIDFSMNTIADLYMEKRTAAGESGEKADGNFYLINGGRRYALYQYEKPVTNLMRSYTLEDMYCIASLPYLMGGFVDHTEDIVEVTEEKNEETGVSRTVETVVGQRAYLTVGSYMGMKGIAYTGNYIVSGGYDKMIRYNQNRYSIQRPTMLSTILGDVALFTTENGMSEILSAGPCMGEGVILITQDAALYIPHKANEEKIRIPLSDIRFDINMEVDKTSRNTKKEEEETTEEDPQKIQMTHAQETAEIPTGVHEEGYTKENEELFNKIDPNAVEAGAKSNMDSAQAGITETQSYDKEQMENDGIVVSGQVLTPSVDVNPDFYHPDSFIKYNNGFLITSVNSGIIFYHPDNKNATQILGYPMYRTWQLKDGSFVSIGFDDNSKRYQESDLPFAKMFFLSLAD